MNRPLEIFLGVEQIGKLEGGDDHDHDNHGHDDGNHDHDHDKVIRHQCIICNFFGRFSDQSKNVLRSSSYSVSSTSLTLLKVVNFHPLFQQELR